MSDPQIDDGGSAFPNPAPQDPNAHPGMSLRDWFAGQVLTRICKDHAGVLIDPKKAALLSYEYAIAMIESRRVEKALLAEIIKMEASQSGRPEKTEGQP